MSSVYMIICLSHDPAIAFGGEDERGVSWNNPEQAIEALQDRTSGPAQAHPNCDLVIGRCSYPLIEVCCPASRSRIHSGYHRDDLWVDASWLRLLALATPEHADAARLRGCWTKDTAWKLRHELNLEVKEGA